MRVRRDDAGQVATAVLVAAMLGTIAVLVLVLLPLAGATDQRSRAQTAADAAALAHVDSLGRGVGRALGRPLGFGGGRLDRLVDCVDGRAAADDFAARNGAATTNDDLAGCGAPARTAVTVDVRMLDDLPSGQRSEARARASMGFPTGRCDLSPDPQQLIEDFLAASGAAQAASAAVDAAELAAAEAAAALSAAVNASPERAAALEQALQDAQQAAEEALSAAESAGAAVRPAEVRVRADCGPVELELLLALPGARLSFERVTGADLDELLEPRLVSTRQSGL